MANQEKVVFNGFNSLRAIGAIAVFISHIELLRKDFEFSNHIEASFFKHTGGELGVVLFFVLSGFLITYLLLAEKERFGTISLGKFYLRRILRIWPIYYLMIFTAFAVLPFVLHVYPGKNFDHYWGKIILCILFAPNVSLAFFGGMPGASHLWSIGVEEQFYLVWPWLVEKLYNWLVPALILIFLGISLAPHISDWLFAHCFKNPDLTHIHTALRRFFDGFKINSMAIGALFAVLFFRKKESLLKILYHPAVEVIAFISAFGLWILGISPKYFSSEFYSILFAIVILNVGTNPKPIFSLKGRIMDFYGKISYGFYVYHWAVIIISYIFIRHYGIDKIITGWGFDIVAYALPFTLTTLASAISYFYFEKAILQYKNRFERIASGNS